MCPGCGRCNTCGHPGGAYPQPIYPQPIWIAPQTYWGTTSVFPNVVTYSGGSK